MIRRITDVKESSIPTGQKRITESLTHARSQVNMSASNQNTNNNGDTKQSK